MSLFEDRLNDYLGGVDDATDIRAVVRRCWFYDFDGIPTRIWQGKGKLYTSDGNEWLGTIDANGNDVHQTPRLSDGRDGTAPTYEFRFGYIDRDTYEALKSDQALVAGRPLVCYLALFRNGEGLRPETPIDFFKELTMQSTKFEERLVLEGTSMVRRYLVTVIAKDGNSGRSSIPGRSYADTHQKRYARELGVELDRGAEFLAGLANRTYKVP
jgi:hypothetical protein